MSENNYEKEKNEAEYDDGTYVVKKKGKRVGVVALIVCLLIAFVIWCYAKGSDLIKQQELEGNLSDNPTVQASEK